MFQSLRRTTKVKLAREHIERGASRSAVKFSMQVRSKLGLKVILDQSASRPRSVEEQGDDCL